MSNKDADTRIVEMQFDAKDFDKGIRQSTKNLEDFKKQLDFDDTVKQMGAVIDKGGPMNNAILGMAQNLKKLATEFTGIGNVSTFVAQKVKHTWQEAVNSVERFAKSLTSDQIREGQQKYDKLLQSVQTIKNATGDSEEFVYKIMGDLNDYTDATSYNFADMAQNIGKFTTVGIGLEDAERAMEGIANWAALSGQNAATASRAMYNISQAMSANAMLKLDWRSIQNAGMDTRTFREEAIKAAEAVGTLVKKGDKFFTKKGNKEVNLDNFAETLQFKWFDKATMMKVFDTFSDSSEGIGKQAYAAAQRCITFSDALGAWKDMLSTGWMQSYEHVFGKLSEAMGLFSGMCDKVGIALEKFVSLRNGILERWNIGGGRNSLWGALVGELKTPDGETLFKGAYGLLDAMNDLGNAIYDSFWDFVGRFISDEDKKFFDKNREGEGMRYIAKELTILTNKLQEFTGKIQDFLFKAPEGEVETRFDRLRHIGEAIFAAFTVVFEIIKAIGGAVQITFKLLSPALYAIEQLIDEILIMFTGAVADGAKKNVVGSFLQTFAAIAAKVTRPINGLVIIITGMIRAFLQMINQSGVVQLLISLIKAAFDTMASAIGNFLSSGVIQLVLGWIQKAILKIPTLVEKIRAFIATISESAKSNTKLQTFWKTLKDVFSTNNLKTILTSIKNWVKKIFAKIPSLFSTASGGIGGFFSSIFEGFLNLFVGSAKADEAGEEIVQAAMQPIIELGSGTAIEEAVAEIKPDILTKLKTKVGEIWKNITDFFTTLANSDAMQKVKAFFAGTTFMELLSGAKELMKWLSIFEVGHGVSNMGKGLKSIGKGVKVFSKNMKNLNLSNIFSNMFNISNIINSNNSTADNSRHFDFGNLGPQLLEIAGAVLVLTLAAKDIIAMKEDDLKKAGIGLGVLLAGLLTASFIAKKVAGNGGSLLGIAAALWLIIIPMKKLMEIPWIGEGEKIGGGLLEMLGKLTLVMIVLAGAARLAGSVKMKGLVSMAIAITLLLAPIKILGVMGKLGSSVDIGIIRLEAIALAIAAVAGVMGVTNFTGFKGMIPFALAMTILLIPIKKLAEMSLGKAAQGVIALGALMAAITFMVVKTKDAEPGKLAGLVAAITVLSTVGWLIGHTMNWQQALIGFTPILAIIGMMSLMFSQVSKMDEAQIKALKVIFVSLSALVAIMAVSVVAISALGVSEKTMIEFFGGMIIVLLSLSSIVKRASKLKEKEIRNVAIVLGAMSVLVLAVAGSMILLNELKVDPKIVEAFSIGMAALIAAIGFALPKLGSMNIKGALIGIVALAGGVVAVMGAIALMLPVVLGSVGNAMEKLAGRLKTMSGLLSDFFERMNGIDDGAIEHTKEIFGKLADMIKQMAVIGLLGGEIQNVMSELNYLGVGLDLFFVGSNKLPDPENAIQFKILDKFVTIGPSLSTFTAGSLPEQLIILGAALGIFQEATKNITTDKPLALSLLEGIFGQADNINTFSQLPLDTFTSQMTGLGGAMSLYAQGAEAVTGLKTSGGEVPNISESVGILKQVCSAIAGDDDQQPFTIPENMPDETKLGVFAGQLSALGMALSSFATAAKDMETDTDKATSLLTFLAEVGGYVTPSNLEVVKAFDDVGHATSDNGGGALGQFAIDIAVLGYALGVFADSIGGKETAFTTGLDVVKKFGDLNSQLTADNLKFAKVFNTTGIHRSALDTFATDIGGLGRAIASFAQNVAMDDGTQADFNYALRALNFMTVMSGKLSGITVGTSLYTLIHGQDYTLGMMSEDMTSLGQSLKDMSTAITGAGDDTSTFNYDGIMQALDAVNSMISIMNSLNLLKPETGSWLNIGDYMSMLSQLMEALTNEEVGYRNNFNGSIATVIAQFAKDISAAFANTEGIDSTAIAAFHDLAGALADLTKIDPSLDFEYPGEMISKGIAVGIRNGQSEVVQAIIDVVQAAIDAGNETAVVKSPSHVFAEMGEYMDLGLAKGINDGQSKVEDESTNMVNAAIEQARLTLGAISSVLSEAVDMQPTITPVLDLSQITGAGPTLNRIFDGYALNLTNALNRAAMAAGPSGPTDVIVQNPTDLTGIQSAIETLQTEVVNLQTAISNIKIVLNNGAIAGGITDDIDLNLGRKSLYASRRN